MESGHPQAARLIPAVRLRFDFSYCVCFALPFFQLPQEEGKCDYIFLAPFAGVSLNVSFPRP